MARRSSPPGSGARWWARAVTVVATAAALVGAYLVPAVPATATEGTGPSEADRAAAAAAAAPPSAASEQGEDDGGNWFTDLFGGGDDAPQGEPIPGDADLAPEQHEVDARVATPAEPGARVKELVGRRTVNSRTFLLDDGQRQVELSGEPLFYETARDGLAEISTTVTATGKAVSAAGAKGLSAKAGKAAASDGWSHASVANTARAFFGQRPDRVVRVEDAAGRGVTVGVPDAEAGELSAPHVDGDTVTHEDVAALGGADLSYEVLPGRVKESIVLDRAPEGPVEFAFTLSDLGDLTPRVEDDGSIGFYGELDPDPVASIPAGVMWDSREAETTAGGRLSAPDDRGAAVSTDVGYELERAGGGSGDGAWTLTVTPDEEWLTDEDRVWPVTVDPTIIVSPTGAFSKDTMILSEAPTTSYYASSRLSVGRTEDGVARAMLAFPQLADVVPAGSTVTDADLGLYFDQAHTDWATRVPLEVREVTGPWDLRTTTWNSANGLQGGIAGLQRTYNNTVGTATGSWPASGNTALTQFAYNQDYQYKYGNSGGAFAWSPNLPEAGSWQVRLSHVPATDRISNVPVRITIGNGNVLNYTVDQTRGTTGAIDTSSSFDRGIWSVVATHTLGAGTGGAKVELLDTRATADTVVLADAVRFVKGGVATRTPGQIGKWHNYDVTQTVKKWAAGSLANNGLMVRAMDETANGPIGGPRYEAGQDVYGGETRNMPRLTVTYGQPGVVMDIPDTIHATGAELSWSAYKDPSSGTGDNLVEYQVHRSVSQTFTPSATTLVAPVAPGTTSFTDTTAVQTPADATGLGKLYYYQVAVKRRDGTIVPSSTQIVRLPKAGHTTKVLVATGDTSLTSAQPTTPRDTVQDLVTQHWDLVGNASAVYGDTRTVMEWDDSVWSVPDGAVVTDAQLRMWQETTETTRTNPDGSMVYPTAGVYQAYRQNTNFDEATATWNDPDGSGSGAWPAGGNLGSVLLDSISGVGEGPSRLSWDVRAAVQNWVNGPAQYRGLVVKMDDEMASQDRSLFASTEAELNGGLERSGPRLSVTYLSTAPEDTFYAPDTPERMTPGTTYQVPVTVSNTTQTTWVAGSQELVASWTLPDGTVAPGSTPTRTALPEDLSSGEVADITARVVAPPVSDGNLRSDYALSWEIANTTSAAQEESAREQAKSAGEDSARAAASAQGLDTTATGGAAEQTEAVALAEAGIAALPAGKLKQNVAVEDPTSDQLGLESFYTYAGKNTGAGSTLMTNVAAGNAVWSYDAFSNPGRGLSTFARFAYNSQDTSDTVSGFGWSAQVSGPIRLGAPLEFHPNSSPREVMLPDGDGTTHVFRLNTTTGAWDAPAGVNYRLTQKTGVDCRASNKDPDPDAWTMLRPDGTKFVFGCDGYLNQVIDKNGNTQQFTYAERNSNNQPRKFLQYITDPTGRQTLTVDYWTKSQTGWKYVDEATGNLVTGSGGLNNSKIYDHVRSMTDVSGRKIEFYYTTKGLMGRMIDGAGSTDASGASIAKTYRFTYDADQGNKNAKLTAVTDPRGNTTRIGYYYPSEGDDPKDHWSVQTITDRLGGDTGFDYVPHATNDGWWNSTVTDAEGNATSYVSDDFGRPRSVTNAKTETVSLTWDGDNNVRTLTEDNGAVTAYCYDPKTGYPVWQRDAEQNAARGGAPAASECVAGETAEQAPAGAQVMEYRTWESGYVAQIARTTSPQGRKNQFTYDAVGNLLTVVDGKGIETTTAGDYTTSYTYDTYGQLLTATDANENTTSYDEFQDTGLPALETDAAGHEYRTTYDERGLVTRVVAPLNGVVTQAYDAFGRPQASTQRKSSDETITTPAPVWDANDNVTRVTAPNGAVTTTTHDAADQIVVQTAPKFQADAPERVTSYSYDAVGNLISATEPKGNLTPEDPDDFVTRYVYDAIYQQTAVVNANSDRVEYDYDRVGNVVEVRDPLAVASTTPDDYSSRTEYDLNHRPVAAVDAAGNRSTTVFDADGFAVSATDAAGAVAYTTYDERGARIETKAPYSGAGEFTVYRTTKYEYDEVGNTTRVITPRGAATAADGDFAVRTEYDELNRAVKQFQPYDPADARYNDANVYTETTYDAAGRVVKTSTPPSDNQTVRNDQKVEYFDNGWIKSSVDGWGIATSYDYNVMGQQTARTLTSADGATSRTMTWDYYPDGRLQAKSDDGVPVGANITLADNSDTQLASWTGAWTTANAADEQGYDHATHAKVAGESPDEFTWRLDVPADGTYDLAVAYPQIANAASGAKYTLTHGDPEAPDGSESAEVVEPPVVIDQTIRAGAWVELGSYGLTAGERVTLSLSPSTTGVAVADGVRLARDNSTDVDTEQRTFTYDYDANGNLVSIDDASSGARVNDYTITYDGLNQAAGVREALSGAETAITSYTYNANGQARSVTHPDQHSEYTYGDARRLLTQVSIDDLRDSAAARITRYTYDARGAAATEVKGNGNAVTYDYYLDGSLKSKREETSAGGLVASHEYTYDANGNPATDTAAKTSADDGSTLSTTTQYTYDPAERLTRLVRTGHGAATEEYRHDANANVVSQTLGGATSTFVYDRNRLQSSSTPGTTSTAYHYDPFGRQASAVSDGKVIARTTYDGFDHIARSEQAGADGALTATTYEYDPLDRTASKTTGSGTSAETTDFTYLGLSSEVLSEEVAGELTKSYQYSPWGQRLSQITHQANSESGIEAGETAYYGYNAHTDVETITDDNGATIGTYGYSAYGQDDTTQFTGIDAPAPGNPTATDPYNSYRYNAKRWDAGSETYDMGFRDYDPGLNRFTTRDMYNGALSDLGLGTDAYTGNRYAFGAGNPISGIEYDGHCLWDACVLEGAAAIVGALVIATAVVVAIAIVAYVATEYVIPAVRDAADDLTVATPKAPTSRPTKPGGAPAPLTGSKTEPAPSPSGTNPSPSPTGQGCAAGGSGWVNYGTRDSAHGNRATQMNACVTGDMLDSGKSPGGNPPGKNWARGVAAGMGLDANRSINACHLLAKRLGGNGSLANLATCSRGANAADSGSGVADLGSKRAQNQMAYYEAQVYAAVSGGQDVRYTVTPLYAGSRTVPFAFSLTASGSYDNGTPGIQVTGVIIANDLNGINLGLQSSGGAPVPTR